MNIFTMLTVLFVGLKLTGFINWSWWLVLLPFYGGFVFFFMIFFFALLKR